MSDLDAASTRTVGNEAGPVGGGTDPAEARILLVGYYAAAADAAGVDNERVHTTAQTVGELARDLSERHGEPMASIITASKFLIGDNLIRDPATPLGDTPALDILPPFAGG